MVVPGFGNSTEFGGLQWNSTEFGDFSGIRQERGTFYNRSQICKSLWEKVLKIGKIRQKIMTDFGTALNG